MPKPIPIGVSPRHVHLSKPDFIALFGQGSFLSKRNDLSQKGQFASEQTVTLATPIARLENVRVLGPFRDSTQVEISASDAFYLGLKPPVRDSGIHEGTPGITILNPRGSIEIPRGVILAQRHIHMTPADAKEFQVRDKDIVWVEVETPPPADISDALRKIVFGDVIIRIDPSYKLDFHLDTDEANAAAIFQPQESFARILPETESPLKQKPGSFYERKRVYSEWDVRQAQANGVKITVEKSTILTPSARDYGLKWDIFVYV